MIIANTMTTQKVTGIRAQDSIMISVTGIASDNRRVSASACCLTIYRVRVRVVRACRHFRHRAVIGSNLVTLPVVHARRVAADVHDLADRPVSS